MKRKIKAHINCTLAFHSNTASAPNCNCVATAAFPLQSRLVLKTSPACGKSAVYTAFNWFYYEFNERLNFRVREIKIQKYLNYPCRHRRKIGEKRRFYRLSLLLIVKKRYLIICSVNSTNFWYDVFSAFPLFH